MLEYTREIQPEAFIQISTEAVYEERSRKMERGAKEWDAMLPANPYAASKASQEFIALSYWRTYDLPVIITNTMNNFGEMQQKNKFLVIAQKAIAQGKKLTIYGEKGNIGSRSYIHSRNLADALLYILKNHPPYRH